MDNFTAIRNGLLDHIRAGKLCPFDLGVYVFMHLQAEWSTGIYYGCAFGIAHGFNDPNLKEHIQKALRRLRDRQYINYPKGDGKRGSYPILIHKYQVTVGELSGKRLNAWKHGELCQPEYEQQNGRGTVAEQSRNSGGTVAAPIQDFKTVQDVQDEKESGTIASSPATQKRRCQLPEGFEPKQSHRDLAAKVGVNLEATFAAFTDHHASKGNVFKDWDAALNVWIRRESKFNGGAAAAARQQSESRTERRRRNILAAII